jgi:hypothetical protein
LTALIGVENLGFAEPRQGVLERSKAERCVYPIGDAPCQNRSARPIDVDLAPKNVPQG